MGYPKNKFTEDYSIITAWRGSISHGTFVPSTDPNSIDDKDLMCVDILPIEAYFGLKNFMGTKHTVEIKEGEWDIVCYEFLKFVRLLKKGNPNVISMLYLPRNQFLKLSHAGEYLLRQRDIFNSKAIYHSFIGYSRAQLYKMTHMAFKGYMGEKRKGLVEKHGYDTKNAAHLIRLMRMAIEWLDTETFIVLRPDAGELIEIKNGAWSLEKVKEEAERLFVVAEEKFKKCTLPEEPNHEAIDDLCVSIIQNRHLIYTQILIPRN